MAGTLAGSRDHRPALGQAREKAFPYLRRGDDYLLSRPISAITEPHWLLNLQAEPEVLVQIRRKLFGAG